MTTTTMDWGQLQRNIEFLAFREAMAKHAGFDLGKDAQLLRTLLSGGKSLVGRLFGRGARAIGQGVGRGAGKVVNPLAALAGPGVENLSARGLARGISVVPPMPTPVRLPAAIRSPLGPGVMNFAPSSAPAVPTTVRLPTGFAAAPWAEQAMPEPLMSPGFTRDMLAQGGLSGAFAR